MQFLLLREGIESAELTTDAGIDLVAFAPRQGTAVTIQVKTNLRPKRRAGGRGKPVLDWWLALCASCDNGAASIVFTYRFEKHLSIFEAEQLVDALEQVPQLAASIAQTLEELDAEML